ncbi:MAG: transcriptional repressor [Oligoflexia bacterium]|nr:transcriptional repressor [Oligoflexia bacterium]
MRQRTSLQLRTIQQVFESSKHPLLAEEALSAAQRKLPSLGIATLYRAIRSLRNSGFLKVVELPGESTRYEMSCKDHHHHFHCRKCKRVFEVESCPAAIKNFKLPDFVIEDHEITFYGLCTSCKDA